MFTQMCFSCSLFKYLINQIVGDSFLTSAELTNRVSSHSSHFDQQQNKKLIKISAHEKC